VGCGQVEDVLWQDGDGQLRVRVRGKGMPEATGGALTCMPAVLTLNAS